MVAALAAGMVAWLCVADSGAAEIEHGQGSWSAMRGVFGMRAVWVIAVVVEYEGVGCYSGCAYEGLGRIEADAVGFSAGGYWIWLVGVLVDGLLRDTFGIARMVWVWFGTLECWRAILDLLGKGAGILVILYTNFVVGYFFGQKARGCTSHFSGRPACRTL